MTRGRAGGLAAVTIGAVGWCLVLGELVGGDPLLAVLVSPRREGIDLDSHGFLRFHSAFGARLRHGSIPTTRIDVPITRLPRLPRPAPYDGAGRDPDAGKGDMPGMTQ